MAQSKLDRRLCRIRIFSGVETLITYPMTQTHADVPEHIRKQNGITDCVLRMSVGIENVKDLLNELEEVFAEVRGE